MSDLKQRHDHRLPDLSEPTVEGLIYLLRHRELWPPSFGPWNYNSADTCALGLMGRFWSRCNTHSASAAVILNIDSKRSSQAFCSISTGNVQPEDVANVLEDLVPGVENTLVKSKNTLDTSGWGG